MKDWVNHIIRRLTHGQVVPVEEEENEEEHDNCFCKWMDESGDQTLHFICHIVLPCLESIFMFREGVRENHHHLVENARKIFRQIRYG
uniref:Uncharacterized protein n=1 Tax=Magallana gigas TaxID=29159 RepID=K1PMT9_MAGGI